MFYWKKVINKKTLNKIIKNNNNILYSISISGIARSTLFGVTSEIRRVLNDHQFRKAKIIKLLILKFEKKGILSER